MRYGLAEKHLGWAVEGAVCVAPNCGTMATLPSPAMYDRVADPLLKIGPSKWRSNLVRREDPQGRRYTDACEVSRRDVFAALLAVAPIPKQIVIDGP